MNLGDALLSFPKFMAWEICSRRSWCDCAVLNAIFVCAKLQEVKENPFVVKQKSDKTKKNNDGRGLRRAVITSL